MPCAVSHRRVERSAALLPPWRWGLTHLGQLRYQLLTAIAGTVAWAQAQGTDRAVLIVHEFATASTRDVNHHRNAAGLDAFVTRISNGVIAGEPSGSVGEPISLPAS